MRLIRGFGVERHAAKRSAETSATVQNVGGVTLILLIRPCEDLKYTVKCQCSPFRKWYSLLCERSIFYIGRYTHIKFYNKDKPDYANDE